MTARHFGALLYGVLQWVDVMRSSEVLVMHKVRLTQHAAVHTRMLDPVR